MFESLKKKTRCMGAVLFRGSIPPRPEKLDGLAQADISASPKELDESAHWALELHHPDWGGALLVCPRRIPPPPREIIEQDLRLTPDEREAAALGQSTVSLLMEGKRANVLRDRKFALRFLRAVMGDDGVAAIDYMAQSIWSRAAIDDELSHDADLDVEGIFTMHAVSADDAPDQDGGKVRWLHSHGLAEIGTFDFDILRPSEDLFGPAVDTFRAIAFAIVEGQVGPTTPRHKLADPGGVVRCVKAEDFDKLASPADRAPRAGADEDHRRNRAVLCEPAGRLFGRWSRRVKPSKFLSRPVSNQMVLGFSSAASDLMAERAKNTYGLFRRLAGEFAEFEFPTLVKLGYRVDGGGEDDKEHLWFSVHEFADDSIDATLENQPFGIERLKPGDRGSHPIELLSDWTIMTPAGNISPRSTVAARNLRPHLDEMRELMARSQQEDDE